MSGRIFQNIVLQFKETTDTVIGVIDSEGTVIACTDLPEIGQRWPHLVQPINEAEGACTALEGKTFKALEGWGGQFDFAAFTRGEDALSSTVCSMATVALNTAKSYYEEKHDKTSFVKSILSDNILLSDIYVRAKELHVEAELNRGVFAARTKRPTLSPSRPCRTSSPTGRRALSFPWARTMWCSCSSLATMWK